jgi:hypothetical protein
MTLKNPIDNDRIKLFPKDKQKEYLRQCDMKDGGCNDAELVEEMRRDGTLKVLDPARYGRPQVRAVGSQIEPNAGFGFMEGDTVVVTIRWPWMTDRFRTKVRNVLSEGFIRTVDGELYPVSHVEHARSPKQS